MLFFAKNSRVAAFKYAYFCRPVERYFLEFQYVGTAYHGWQVQLNAPSVQSELNQALSTLLGEKVETLGAGRTDTGVHAKQMYCHFDVSRTIQDKENFAYRLNSLLPADINVLQVIAVHSDAHARFDATERHYLYRVITERNPFELERAWFHPFELDWTAMNNAAQVLFEYEDFGAFSKSNTQVKTNNCKIIQAEWKAAGNLLEFRIAADRFLRNMVRAIVGTMVEVGRGQMDIKGFRKVIESKDRREAGYSVPAHGLYLTRVIYPENYFMS